MFRIAIVGTGKIAHTHIRSIKMLEGVEIAALCDINEESVKALAEENNVPYFLDYKDIPKNVECDAVIINLPHFLHCESTVFFLENGINVLLEKPMANSTEECDKMIEAEKKSGKKLGIAHIMRFYNPIRQIKEFINSGELGKLVMVSDMRNEDYYNASRPRWFLTKKLSGGGVTMNFGAHFFDKMFYLIGEYPTEVHANCTNLKPEFDVESNAQIFAKFPGGTSATFMVGGHQSIAQQCYYIFTGGALRTDGMEISVMKKGESQWTELESTYDDKNFAREINSFIKYVHGEESDIPTSEYGREVISAIEKVFEGLR